MQHKTETTNVIILLCGETKHLHFQSQLPTGFYTTLYPSDTQGTLHVWSGRPSEMKLLKQIQSRKTHICLFVCLRRFVSHILVTVMAAFGAFVKHLKSYITHCFVMLPLYSEDEQICCKSLSPILKDEHRTSELH